MRVVFINVEFTRARLIRGWLWWRQVAEVEVARTPQFGHCYWRYVFSHRECETGIVGAIYDARFRAERKAARMASSLAGDWIKPSALPRARRIP